MNFIDVRKPVFRAECAQMDDMYRRGMIVRSSHESVKYKVPRAPEQREESLQVTANIYDAESARWVAAQLRGVDRRAVAVS